MKAFLQFLLVFRQQDNVLKQVFDYFDTDHQGTIGTDDLKRVFYETKIGDEEFFQMLDDYDVDGDRKISFEREKVLKTYYKNRALNKIYIADLVDFIEWVFYF